jgi:ABC-type transport system involved in cytochrome c biogenesis permease subunit
MCLAVGIILGAVWANVSWGSYWSWDPKEVWALVTMIFYGIAFHRQSLSWLRRPIPFHLYMIFCFLTVLMTYFGVNYLLGGMHSYGG